MTSFGIGNLLGFQNRLSIKYIAAYLAWRGILAERAESRQGLIRTMNRIICIIIFLATLAAVVFGQDSTYRLQPEDVIRIQIYNEQQVTAVVPVGKDGNISAPFVGIMRAEGKTTSELEADLVQEYIRKLRLRDPRVSVTIERFRPVYASIGGAVNRPGRYEIRPTDTILGLINQGGGPLFSNGNVAADLKKATLQRGNTRELIPIDLDALLNRGDRSQDYVLQDGDILSIPEDKNNRINLIGAIQRPSSYPYTDGMNLADAIALAGDSVPYRSKMSDTLVIRKRPGMPGQYLRIKCNFVNYLTKGDASQNITLKAGDIIFIPETKTPSTARIGEIASALANSLYILDRFGINILGKR